MHARPQSPRLLAALVAGAALVAVLRPLPLVHAPIASARADECRGDVPPPGGPAAVYSDEPRITLSWTFPDASFYDAFSLQAMTTFEVAYRDDTAGGGFDHTFTADSVRPSGTSHSRILPVAATVPASGPVQGAFYAGRSYSFRVRAVSSGLPFPQTGWYCTGPWSTDVSVSVPGPPAPGLSLGAGAIDFGDVEVGLEADRLLTVRNGNDAPLAVRYPKPGVPFRHGAALTADLGAKETRELTLTFAPVRTGTFERAFVVRGPAGVAPATVQLRGRGVPATPRLVFDPPSLDFGPVRGSGKRTVLVTNTIGKDVEARFSRIEPPFFVLGGATRTIPAHATVPVEFEFLPRTRQSPFTADVRVSVRGVAGSPRQTLPLAGELPRTVRVVSLTGDGVEFRVLPGDFMPVGPDTEIPENADISCDPDSAVVLELPGGSQVDMGPATQIQVGAFFRKGGVVRAEILAKVGDLVSRIPRIPGVKSDFKIRAPTAIAGVRGTEFRTFVDEATGATTFQVFQGTVSVDPLARGARTFDLHAGEQVTVTAEGAGPVTPLPAK